jgi:Fic family protein
VYIWQRPKWPVFHWDAKVLTSILPEAARQQGRLLGWMESLGFDLRTEANLRTLTEDVVKSSEIEGENLDSKQVRSSIARRLGMDVGGLVPADQAVDGIVELMLDATGNFSVPLTEERLFGWHAALFPTGRSGMHRIVVGQWRDDSEGPMQVVSGPIGKRQIHYEAPPAKRVPAEMDKFMEWFNAPDNLEPQLAASLAHLWFVTIHPFDDGNGRIARALADMVLARSEKTGQRFYSMSTQIRRERSDYYNILEATQKGTLDITHWQTWSIGCFLRAIEGAHGTLENVIKKARFWKRFERQPLSRRQIEILNLLLDNFEGKLTTSKWAKLAKCSQDTAHRDIQALIDRGVLKKDPGGGRSTSYSLILSDVPGSNQESKAG